MRLKCIMVFVVLLSILFIIKTKNISRYDIVAGILFRFDFQCHLISFMGAISIVAYLGGASVFKQSDNKIVLLKLNNKKEILKLFLLCHLEEY